MDAIEHLAETAWKAPSNYSGFSPDGDYVILSKGRDSTLLEQCNWDVACDSLHAVYYEKGNGGIESRPMVYHWQARHWAIGWMEYLCVRSDAPESTLTTAGELVCALAEYPVLDDTLYSKLEFEAVLDYWSRCNLWDKVEYLQRAELSIFAARRDDFPRDPSGVLFAILREGL